MTKRKLVWFSAVSLLLVSLAIGIFGLSGTRTIRIDEADIQKRLDAQLPKEYKNVKLTKASVNLGESDVRITLSLEGHALGQSFSLDAVGVGVPEYRQEKEAFFFRPSKLAVSRLELSGESPTDKAGKAIDRYITDPKLKERLANSLPGVKRWIEDNLEPRALATFGEMPLYQPKNDMKGTIIKATLEKVEVQDGALVLHFSLWELTKTVVVAVVILLLAIGMIGALVLCPELFLIVAILPH